MQILNLINLEATIKKMNNPWKCAGKTREKSWNFVGLEKWEPLNIILFCVLLFSNNILTFQKSHLPSNFEDLDWSLPFRN